MTYSFLVIPNNNFHPLLNHKNDISVSYNLHQTPMFFDCQCRKVPRELRLSQPLDVLVHNIPYYLDCGNLCRPSISITQSLIDARQTLTYELRRG